MRSVTPSEEYLGVYENAAHILKELGLDIKY
jgi:hypothetical protein